MLLGLPPPSPTSPPAKGGYRAAVRILEPLPAQDRAPELDHALEVAALLRGIGTALALQAGYNARASG